MELVADSEEYEIGWCEVAAKSHAVGLEQRLLERYFEQHSENTASKLEGLITTLLRISLTCVTWRVTLGSDSVDPQQGSEAPS